MPAKPSTSITVTWGPALGGNPYQELLEEALRGMGANTVAIARPTIRGALRARPGGDVLHVHWLEFLVRSDGSSRLSYLLTLLKSIHLLLVLWLMRARGIRVVWTVHNLLPHETRYRRLELWLSKCVARRADVVIAHSAHCARLVESTYGIEDVRVAYHPHFMDHYAPPTRTREEMRAELGVPEDAHTFLAFGQIRAYKQIPQLVLALKETGRVDLHLLIVGQCRSPAVRHEIDSAINGEKRVTVRYEFVPDDIVTDIHAAADVAVLNYRDVFSSSALMLALSCGIPVIAPAKSTATEVADPPVVQSYAPGGLADALIRSASTPGPSAEVVLAVAAEYTWTALAEPVLGEL
jgi:beta-1,4-mannosyltransferase